MGSGTTAIAAHDTGRNWIGFERNENYYEAALKRIEDAMKDNLFTQAEAKSA